MIQKEIEFNFITKNALQHLQNLSKSAIVTFLWLGIFANKDGIAWPSVEVLAKAGGISKNSVRQAIKKLRMAGLIKIQPRPSQTNYYFVPDLYRTVKLFLGENGEWPSLVDLLNESYPRV